MENQNHPQTKKRSKIWIPVVIVIFALASAAAWIGYLAVLAPTIQTDAEYFYVHSDDSYDDVMRRIKDENIVRHYWLFERMAKAMDLSENINPGRYRLESGMNNRRFIGNLRGGYQEAVKFRFQNLRLKENFAGLLGQTFEADSAEFAQLLQDTAVATKYGFTSDNVFSMFIPNTYEIYWNTKPEEIFARFHTEYNNFWNADRKAKADALNMTTQEVSSLAAIVKGEAMHVDEMPKIAGLYINRLKRGILLQADPTVIFANNDFTIRRVLNRHLTIDNPYNTYRYKGLPPGPIMMPSIASIGAVLNYDKHDYIYMCAKDDFSGYHLFAKTMADHLVNARKFQRALDERNIKR